jgi:chemotaxis protein histidine kinase CheA
LTLKTSIEEDAFVFRMVDDGRGIDWSTVRECAQRKGLPCDAPQERANSSRAANVRA